MFKNFVSICVTLHKGVMIWLGKDEDEIEEYVITEPYILEPEEIVHSPIGEQKQNVLYFTNSTKVNREKMSYGLFIIFGTRYSTWR